ncbi:CHAT domain-containing protein [Vreelandella titanicae]|uniref:CHAT domain-containing protein n=1 Tax=Vreelandella titanicae TaxID=664683 RepID=UPI0039BECFE5
MSASEREKVRERINRANVLLSGGNLASSEALLSEAIEISQKLAFEDEELQASISLSHCRIVEEKMPAARELLERSIQLAANLDDSEALGKSYLNLGGLIIEESPTRAIEAFEKALAAFESVGNNLGIGQTLDNIGIAYSGLGARRTAINYVDRALRHLREANEPVHIGLCYLASANLLTDVAKEGLEDAEISRSMADEYYHLASQLFQEHGAHAQYIKCHDCLALLRRDEKRYDEAIALHWEAIFGYSRLKHGSALSSALLNLGTSCVEAHKLNDAKDAFNAAGRIKQQINDQIGLARVNQNLGTVLNTEGRHEEALPLLEHAANFFDRSAGAQAHDELQTSFSDLYFGSWSEYLFALSQVTSSKSDEERRNSFLLQLERSKANQITRHLSNMRRRLDSSDESWLKALRERIDLRWQTNFSTEKRRSLRRRLKNGFITGEKFDDEIKNLTASHQNAVFKLRTMRTEYEMVETGSIDGTDPRKVLMDLQKAYHPEAKAGFLYIVEFPQRENLQFLYVTNGSIEHRSTDFTRGEREHIFSQLHDLRTIKPTDADDVQAMEAILDNLAHEIGGAFHKSGLTELLCKHDPDTVVLLPQGALHYMPWEIAEMDGTKFGLQWAIIRNYSASLLQLMADELEGKTQVEGTTSALIYCPTPADLPGTPHEVESIAKTLRSEGSAIKAIVADDFSRDGFIADCQRANLKILHFAGHSHFAASDPMMSSLILGGRELPDDERHLTALEIEARVRFQAAPLVFLNSCHSGASSISNVDDAFGLVRAFLLAGVKSIIHASDAVFDVSASDFAAEFYEEVLKGARVEEALRLARKTIAKRSSNNAYLDGCSLVHWAPYLLYGLPGALASGARENGTEN